MLWAFLASELSRGKRSSMFGSSAHDKRDPEKTRVDDGRSQSRLASKGAEKATRT
jgi:hypothetical protein